MQETTGMITRSCVRRGGGDVGITLVAVASSTLNP